MNIGLTGDALFKFFPFPSAPIVRAQVRLDVIVASEQTGTDLRSTLGQSFSVPRTAGTYNMTVWAQDVNGCTTTTTAARPVRVQ